MYPPTVFVCSVARLVQHFLAGEEPGKPETASFAAFKAVWRSRQCSSIHAAVAAGTPQGDEFLQGLYAAALGVRSPADLTRAPPHSPPIASPPQVPPTHYALCAATDIMAREEERDQRAGLFALCCLYQTQPRHTGDGSPHAPVQIAVSVADLERLVAMHRAEVARPVADHDALAVLTWLHQAQPFFFVGYRKGAPAEAPAPAPKAAKNDPEVTPPPTHHHDTLTLTDRCQRQPSPYCVPQVLGADFDSIPDGMAAVSDPRLEKLKGLYARARAAAGLGAGLYT